jgi:catechol 2,3-dioxygenase-like lactoylglutathione lyase family enzyme
MISGGIAMLFVTDVAKSTRFFVETLGMKLVQDGGAHWAAVDAGDGFVIGLHLGEPSTAEGAPKVGLAPKVPIDDAIAILDNRGVRFEVRREGGRVIADFVDPDGNRLYLYSGG